jgi:hypothetical protein
MSYYLWKVNKFLVAILILFSLKVSYGQSWDDEDWGSESDSVYVNERFDTIEYNGFKTIVDTFFRWSNDAHITEEYYYPFKIELLKNNLDSAIVLMSRSSDLRVSRTYNGFKIKAKLGTETARLYVGKLMKSDTAWLDTIAFKVRPLEPLTSFSGLDSLCHQVLGFNPEFYGGLGQGMCTWIISCKITEFKIKIEGSIEANYDVKGNLVPFEALNGFKKLQIGDVVIFYDIIGTTNKYKTKVEFSSSRLVIKSCDR